MLSEILPSIAASGFLREGEPGRSVKAGVGGDSRARGKSVDNSYYSNMYVRPLTREDFHWVGNWVEKKELRSIDLYDDAFEDKLTDLAMVLAMTREWWFQLFKNIEKDMCEFRGFWFHNTGGLSIEIRDDIRLLNEYFDADNNWTKNKIAKIMNCIETYHRYNILYAYKFYWNF